MNEEQLHLLAVLIDEKVRKSIGPFLKDLTSSSFRYETGRSLAILLSYMTIMDYIPVIHVMVAGHVESDLFIPSRTEFGTVLDRLILQRLSLSKGLGELTDIKDPLELLLAHDLRFIELLNLFSSGTGEYNKIQFQGEIFPHRGQAFIGAAFRGDFLKTSTTVTKRTSESSVRLKNIKIPSFAFEVFARMAYYANYLRFPREGQSGLQSTEMYIPNLLAQSK
jgi:hypothetical protein